MRSSILSTSADPMPRSEVLGPGLPRAPVFGWGVFTGTRDAGLPCILDRPGVIFTSSGQAAIALALQELGIGRGDRVLVPTYHCPTMIAPVAAAAATPLFFPIDASGAPRLSELEQWDLTGVRAMIAVHYFGLPQPMSEVRQFCDDHGIALIEDCAHAMFGKADGVPIGSHGHYAIASLTKFLPTTDGGCLVCGARSGPARVLPRRALADEIRVVANTIETGANYRRLPGLNRLLRASFGALSALRGSARLPAGADVNDGPGPQLSSASTEPAPRAKPLGPASVWSRWIARSAHRGRIVANRRRNYRQLATLLAGLPGTRVLQAELPEHAAPYVFPLWVDSPARIYPRVRRAGIPVYRWDDVWPNTPLLRGDHGSDWSVHVFQLGCHQDLELDDLASMTDSLREILARVPT
jgi:dTDP-4-amino-4,6-dideoxygalactose transaminase